MDSVSTISKSSSEQISLPKLQIHVADFVAHSPLQTLNNKSREPAADISTGDYNVRERELYGPHAKTDVQ